MDKPEKFLALVTIVQNRIRAAEDCGHGAMIGGGERIQAQSPRKAREPLERVGEKILASDGVKVCTSSAARKSSPGRIRTAAVHCLPPSCHVAIEATGGCGAD